MAALWALSAPAAGLAASVSAVPATVKVLPRAPVQGASKATLKAARNEFEAFQIVVAGPATGVSASAGALKGPARQQIPAANVTLYREALIQVTKPSGSVGKAGVYPDALIPDVDEIDGQKRSAFPFDVPAGEVRAIWVDVLVPEDAGPGIYAGSVAVRGDGFEAAIPIELEVWDFALPSTPSLTTAFLAFSGAICQAHTGSSDCGGQEQSAALMAKYLRLALDHRITLPNPWLGGPKGDWAAFDRVFAPFLNGTAKTRLAGARMTSAQVTGAKTPQAYRDWAEHFRARGWLDRLYDYTADEPPYGSQWSDIPARARVVKAGDADIPVLVTTNVDEAREHGVLGDLDIMVPVVNHMHNVEPPYQGCQRSKYDGFVRSGKRLWMYQSCMSHGCSFGGAESGAVWPSYMIDVPAARNRIMQWADFLEDVSGELYYETANAYAQDPWKDMYSFSGNGDGTLFYPGTPARIGGDSQVPVASIRLKLIREGVEDFEYLTLVARQDPEFAREVARTVLPASSAAGTDDPAAFDSAREQLALRLLGGGAGLAGGCSTSGGGAVLLPGAALLAATALRRRRR